MKDEAAIATLRAIDGICLDALVNATKIIVAIESDNPEDVIKFFDLTLGLMKQMREVHMLTRAHLLEEKAL